MVRMHRLRGVRCIDKRRGYGVSRGRHERRNFGTALCALVVRFCVYLSRQSHFQARTGLISLIRCLYTLYTRNVPLE